MCSLGGGGGKGKKKRVGNKGHLPTPHSFVIDGGKIF